MKAKLVHPPQRSWFHNKNKKRPATGFLWNDTYTEGFLVMFGIKDTEMLRREYRRYNKHPDLTDDHIGDISCGLFLSFEGVNCLAFKDVKPAPGIIAHEAVHFVTALSDDRGINHDRHNDETQAYLTQWVVDRVYNLSRTGKFLI
jgi:hypothetical protein